MTDQQVITYIKQQTALGKTEQQIGRELVARGVTPEQVNRIKAAQKTTPSTIAVDPAGLDRKTLNLRQSETNEEVVLEADIDNDEAHNDNPSENRAQEIFGHRVFNSRNLTFEPNETPPPRRTTVSGQATKS